MILLHTTKYGDSSLILHGYTREAGRQSFMLRGVGKKNKTGTSGTGLLHPLSILDVEISGNGNGNIVFLREFSPKFPLKSLRSDIYKNAIALYISELLYKSLLEEEQDAVLYDFLENSIIALDSMEGDYANFPVWFTVRYASFIGFMPRNGFVMEFNPFNEVQRGLLERFMEEGAMQIPMHGKERSDFISSLLRYLEFHLGSRLDIKSLTVLHQVLC